MPYVLDDDGKKSWISKWDARGAKLFMFDEARLFYFSKKDKGHGVPCGLHYYLTKHEDHFEIVWYPINHQKNGTKVVTRKDGSQHTQTVYHREFHNPKAVVFIHRDRVHVPREGKCIDSTLNNLLEEYYQLSQFNARSHKYPETNWNMGRGNSRQKISSGGGVIIRGGKIFPEKKAKERVTDRDGAREVFAPFNRVQKMINACELVGGFSEYKPSGFIDPPQWDQKFERLVKAVDPMDIKSLHPVLEMLTICRCKNRWKWESKPWGEKFRLTFQGMKEALRRRHRLVKNV